MFSRFDMKSTAKTFLVMTAFMATASVSRAYPTMHEFEKQLAQIFAGQPQKLDNIISYQKQQQEERIIAGLIRSGRKDQVLGNRAYDLALKYIQGNNIQEAIWILKKSGLIAYGQFLEDAIVKAMQSSEIRVYKHDRTGESGSRAKVELSPSWSVDVVIRSSDIIGVANGWGSQTRTDATPHPVEAAVDSYQLDRTFLINLVPVTTAKTKRIWNSSGIELTEPHSVHLAVADGDGAYQDMRPSGKQEYSPNRSETALFYLLDKSLGNVDRATRHFAYEGMSFGVGYTSTHGLYSLRTTRTKSHGVNDKTISWGVNMRNYFRSSVSDLPFNPEFQFPYLVETVVRATSSEALRKQLEAKMAMPKAVDYIVNSYAEIKAGIESRATKAPPVVAEVQPYKSLGLLDKLLVEAEKLRLQKLKRQVSAASESLIRDLPEIEEQRKYDFTRVYQPLTEQEIEDLLTKKIGELQHQEFQQAVQEQNLRLRKQAKTCQRVLE